MPLLRFDLIEGRSEAEIKTLLDAAHRAVLAAFDVPERDRYQIVTEHPASRIIVEDTGLGIDRTDKVVVIQVVGRKRKKKQNMMRARVHHKCNDGKTRPDFLVAPSASFAPSSAFLKERDTVSKRD